jgi:hypothetical protein
MAKISTYGIDAAPTLSDKVIGTRVEDNNNTYNYQFGDIYDLFQAQGGGGLGFVPYIDAINDVDLGVYSLQSPLLITDIISPIGTTLGTEYLGNPAGLLMDLANSGYIFGDTSIGFYMNYTNGYTFTTYNDDPIGVLLDFPNSLYILGDGAEINNGTSLVVSDGITQTINALHQGLNKGLTLNFTADEYQFGNFNGDSIVVDNQYNVIYTQHNGDLLGLELYFPNGEYILGDVNNVVNGTYLKVDDTNERVEISKALYTSASTGTVGQILVSQGSALAPQWQNHASVSNYYGSFYDTTTQTCVSGAIAYMKYNTTVLSAGVSIQNDLGGKPTQILIANAGVYNIQFSAQLNRTTGGADAQVDIWLRKNGVDIPFSATSITMKANAKNVVAAWNFFETVTAGQYLEIAWTQNDAVDIIQYPINLTVPFPAIPSVILTVNKIS